MGREFQEEEAAGAKALKMDLDYSGLMHPPAHPPKLISFLPLFIHIWLSSVALLLLNATV